MTTVKFCGLTRAEDAAFAVSLGASHLGVIFAPSPRQVTLAESSAVFEAAPQSVRRVGVFAPSTLREITVVTRELKLDVVQLHGAPCVSFIPALREVFSGEVWSVVGVSNVELAGKAVRQASEYSDAVLLDTAISGRTGGTGIPFDWEGMERVMSGSMRRIPIVVAGGLNPSNVGKAIGSLRPDIVDVSSGVEASPGIKDHNLMRAFAEAVHSASMV